jgi:hypothetical protein
VIVVVAHELPEVLAVPVAANVVEVHIIQTKVIMPTKNEDFILQN